MNNKTYLVPKKGSDGSDITKSNFLVSPGAVNHIDTPQKIYKHFATLKMDTAYDLKVKNELIALLKETGSWSPHYDQDGTFSDFFRNPKAFNELVNGQRKLTQKQVSEGKYTLEIPKVLKDKAIQAIQKSRQQ
tara:strand:- start:24301 stop:24699 length:399 start_codon:yes stop_codon:yes gene_type:complete